jgi:uncharacterized SAM-binding protein YcdF (DUF218 family)
MFFEISKIAWFLVTPSNLIALALVGGAAAAVWRDHALARALLLPAVLALVSAGLTPLGHVLLLPLEERFPAWRDEGRAPVGIIVLGGSFDTAVSVARGRPALNESAERLTEAAGLARRFPTARLVFTGGDGRLLGAEGNESDDAALVFAQMGIDPARITYELRSRNTWENAVLTKALAQPRAGELWLLVTSAWHMPRAIGAFRAAGFDVVATPVDHRTRGAADLFRPFPSVSDGLRRTDLAVREWIGLFMYRMSGRSTALFPK